ncbi:MAG: gliding motility-associated C-terminal domain-containing protein [Bacteroidota bacterium]
MRINLPELKNLLLLSLLVAFISGINAQNSLVGDGFGGRLWYRPYNISTGSYSAYSYCDDTSQLYAWGYNGFGQLGNGTYINSSTPIKVSGISKVKFVACGYTTAVIKNDSSGWLFGLKFSSWPGKVIDDVKFVSAGSVSCTFVKHNGTVWSVGDCLVGGMFGNGDTSSVIKGYTTPQQMLNVKDAVRVANGAATTIILLKDGTLMGCGSNINKAVGLSNNINDTFLVPRKIPNIKDIVDIKATVYMNIALDKNGDVYQWGNTAWAPTKMTTLKNIVAISARNDGGHFMALDKDMKCYAWGSNINGSFGSGNGSSNNVPVVVATNVVDILAGETFSYIIKADSSLWCTGSSLAGNSSIWMNLNDSLRYSYSQISAQIPPMSLCPLKIVPVEIAKKYTICQGDSIRVTQSIYKATGEYNDTIVSNKGDTLLFTSLKVLPQSKRTQNDTICQGDSFIYNSRKHFVPSTFNDTFTNYLGCDSVVTTQLYVKPKTTFSQTISICQSKQYSIGKRIYTQAGVFKDTFVNYRGCDSIVSTTLVVKPISLFTQTIEICTGQFFDVGTKRYNTSGTYSDTFVNHQGCDSVVTTQLEVKPNSYFSQAFVVCPGQSVTAAGKTYTVPGNYKDTLINYRGCDSIISTQFAFYPLSATVQNISKCFGTSYTIGIHTYNATGVYRDTLTGYRGCDSVVITALDIKAQNTQIRAVEICPNDSFSMGNKTYTKQGIYSDTFKSYLGCDSIIALQLTVKTTGSFLNSVQICKGQYYQFGNKAYTLAGTYLDTFENYNGCDSVVTTTLTYGGCQLKLYNVFTPGTDGLNDVYEISGDALLRYDLYIYNRWGELVYKTEDAELQDRSKFWNGRVMNDGAQCPSGTYYYLFYPKVGDHKVVNGVVQLIR